MPIVFVVASAAIVINRLIAFPIDSAAGLVLVAAGIPVYFIWCRPRASPHRNRLRCILFATDGANHRCLRAHPHAALSARAQCSRGLGLRDAVREVLARQSRPHRPRRPVPRHGQVPRRRANPDDRRAEHREHHVEPKDAAECARIANDEMAELVAKHPDRFCRRVRVSADERHRRRARGNRPRDRELRFRGIEIFTDINGKPLDAPEFMPLYEKMAAYNLPILLHPRRTNTTADYDGEAASKYLVYTNFGWPYETSLAMARLAFGGALETLPDLKIVTHHAGGMIPYFHKRMQLVVGLQRERMGYRHDGQTLTQSPLDYYRMFYCDTAIQGNTPALMCAYEFFGADHMVFATDTPYDNQLGARLSRETIAAVAAMPIDEESRRKIFADNARQLFRLPA